MLIPIFYFDDEKYFSHTGMAQHVDGETLLPGNATTVEPKLNSAHFAKWDGEKWALEAKPVAIEDFVGVKVSHTSQTARNIELRALLQTIVEATEGWRIVRGDESEGLWWGVEKIPEKTEIEKKQEKISELKGRLASTDYVAVKIAEGSATREEYAKVLADRQVWRDEINQLEAEIQALK